MFSLRSPRAPTLLRALLPRPTCSSTTTRTFVSLTRPTTRPTVLGASPFNVLGARTSPGRTETLAPRVSASPALRALQVRNGPRDTFDPSHRVRKRRAGFLARNRKRTGRAILKRRRLKGRKGLTH